MMVVTGRPDSNDMAVSLDKYLMRYHEIIIETTLDTDNDEPWAADLSPIEIARIEVWSSLTTRFGSPMTGRNRAVFRAGRVVVKFPLGANGEADNRHEARLYRDRKELPYPVAPCRLILVRDIPLLVMEYLEPISFKDAPEWGKLLDKGVTGENMGRRASGEIAAYDYANPK